MRACPQCGQENSDDARFCVKCGASLQAQAAATPVSQAAPTVAQPAAPPPQPVPPPAPPGPQQLYQQPYQQPQAYSQPVPPTAQAGTPYAAAPGAYAQPSSRARTRGGLFWVGTLIILVAGALVLASTWMAWGTGPRGVMKLSGWDWFDIGKEGGAGEGQVVNAFFIYSDGRPLFTGLCSLILGGLIALIALLMLIFQSRGLGGVAILFSIFALGMAVTNLTTILRGDGISVGVGTIIFIAFSFLGLVGGGMAMSG